MISVRGAIRWLLAAIVITLIAVGAVLVRLTALSAMHLNEATRAEQADDREAAYESLLWAIRNHYPGNPYSRKAVVRALSSIEEPAETTERQTHQAQLQELRAVLLSIRSFYQPFSTTLDHVNERLTAVSGEQ